MQIERFLTSYETVLRTLEGDGQVRRRKYGYEGSYGHVWDVVLGYEMLLQKLQEQWDEAVGLPDGDYWKVGISLARRKLEYYYNKLDETPIHYTALALHPAYRWDWFEYAWTDQPERIATAKSLVEDTWIAEYSAQMDVDEDVSFPSESESGMDEPVSSQKRQKFHDPFQATRDISDDDDDAPIAGDEYIHWVNHPERSDRKVRDPIKYWNMRRHKYPRLSRMALDFMTIQAMSAECERLFSAAGRVTTPLRSRIDARMLGIVQVLRSWYRSGLVKDPDVVLTSIEDENKASEWKSLSYTEAAAKATAWLADPIGDEEEQ